MGLPGGCLPHLVEHLLREHALGDVVIVDGLHRLDEGRVLFPGEGGDLHPVLEELEALRVVSGDDLVAHEHHLFGGRPEDPLVLFGEGFEPVLVHVEHLRVVLVVHQCEVLLHFVELHGDDVGQRVFLSVGNAGLEGHVGLDEGNGDHVGAQGFHGLDDGGHGRGPDLESLHVFRFRDGADVVRNVAEESGVARGDNEKSRRFGCLCDLFAQGAPGDVVDSLDVREEEGHGVNFEQRGCLFEAAAPETLHGSELDSFKGLHLRAELP
ncbi:hypothetical protein SDC9_44178 [bioreactor metagenome]|uniref:NAD-specific glutamate dehydrogenase n=1 Tax=bioreactor metagenome TaxID=1076179 RepID=A0A644W2Q1_9ZZZZ